MKNVSFAQQIKLDTSAIDGLNLPLEQKKILKSQLTAQFQAEQSILSKEFERYKQDCRKRALDLAHTELGLWYTDVRKTHPNSVSKAPPKVEELAEQYYNWLISIPDSN